MISPIASGVNSATAGQNKAIFCMGDGEVASNFCYSLSYQRANAIAKQVQKLRKLFPMIGNANQDLLVQIEAGKVAIPSGQEDFFAFPDWKLIAPTYGEAVQKVLDLVVQTRNELFTNFCKGQLGSNYLQETDCKVGFMQQIREEQGSDIIILPAQFGLKHRGRSTQRALTVMDEIDENEFSLGTFENSIMLLLHPERLSSCNSLYIDCSGDKVSPDGGGEFICTHSFEFYGAKLTLNTRYNDFASSRFGSTSASAASLKHSDWF